MAHPFGVRLQQYRDGQKHSFQDASRAGRCVGACRLLPAPPVTSPSVGTNSSSSYQEEAPEPAAFPRPHGWAGQANGVLTPRSMLRTT